MAVFKPTCAWIKKEQSAHKRALSTWYRLGNAVGDPWHAMTYYGVGPAAKRARTKHGELVIYAAALGQKQGKLPVNLSGWSGKALWTGDVGAVTFAHNTEPGEPVKIPVRFLDWAPAPAIDLNSLEPMKEAA